MQFFVDEQIGPTQATLPSGALVCKGVTVARCGTQDYHELELPSVDVDADADGMIEVERTPAEVFDPRAMASFEGAPIVMRHPTDEVDPSNWAALSIGHAQNIRRDGDRLVADLVVHHHRGIDAIRNLGWRAVSATADRNGDDALFHEASDRSIAAHDVFVALNDIVDAVIPADGDPARAWGDLFREHWRFGPSAPEDANACTHT